MLTSFATFDALADGDRSTEDIARLVRQLAAAAIDSYCGRTSTRDSSA